MFIYKIENKINNKIYIGCTRQPIKKRWIQHRSALLKGAQQKIYKAMRAIGPDNFYITMIEECNSLKEMSDKELYWIETLDTVVNGYNTSMMRYGARYKKKESYSTMKKEIFSYDIKTKEIEVYDSLSESGFSPSKICQCANEDKHRKSYKGKLWSYLNEEENWKRLIAINSKKAQKRKIICIETQKTYSSIEEASKETKILGTSIGNMLHGRTKKAGGFTWAYIQDSRD